MNSSLMIKLSLLLNTWMLRIPKTALTTGVPHFLRSVRGFKVQPCRLKIVAKYMKISSELDEPRRSWISSRFLQSDAQILKFGHFYRPEWKFFICSSLKIKHPIKLYFSIWHLQSVYRAKKSIPENRAKRIKSFLFSYMIVQLFIAQCVCVKSVGPRRVVIGTIKNV